VAVQGVQGAGDSLAGIEEPRVFIEDAIDDSTGLKACFGLALGAGCSLSEDTVVQVRYRDYRRNVEGHDQCLAKLATATTAS